MSAAAKLRTLALALALAEASVLAPAFAQITTQGPLRDVDPWGVGWLSKADSPLPPNLWANTDGDQLKALFETLKPAGLSPAGRAALRRVILSAGKAPEGATDLILQRLRVLEELGETDHAIDLRRRFASTSWGQEGEVLDAGRDLAASNTGPACRVVAGRPAGDVNWMPLRALCLGLANDFDSAGAVAENWLDVQKRAEGAEADGWLIAAVEAMREPTRAKPPARFDTMFDAALSIHAKLPVAADSFRETPPDVAAYVVRHAFASNEQKRAALRVALDAGKITAQEVRAVYDAPPDPEPPRKPGQRAARPRLDYVQEAVLASGEAKLDDAARAAAYAVAFKSSETPSDFRLAAAALQVDLAKLPKSAATQPQAETFARAALINGDLKEAVAWRTLMDKDAKDRDAKDRDGRDKWPAARIDLMLSFAGASKEKPGAILNRLIAALPADAPGSPGAQTPAARQVAIRRIEVTRALFLYVGAGRDLTPAQRTLLAAQKTAGRGVPDAALARIEAALAAKANGEAALAAIAQLGPDPSALSFNGLADLMTYLSRAGLDPDADAIALEALQVWKAI